VSVSAATQTDGTQGIHPQVRNVARILVEIGRRQRAGLLPCGVPHADGHSGFADVRPEAGAERVAHDGGTVP